LFFWFWAHPGANLPVGQDGARTGLSACIFFASGKKGYRFNPLRVPKSGVLPDFGIGVCLQQTPSIRRRRIAMETAASMPQAKRIWCLAPVSDRERVPKNCHAL
jgi:hypothetical protein